MTDFIPFGTPPGSTGNPKSIIADEFQVGQKIRAKTTAQVSGDTNGTPPNPSRELVADTPIIQGFTPNRNPMYGAYYAATSGNRDTWGVRTDFSNRLTKTPTTGSVDMSDNTLNGRLFFMEEYLWNRAGLVAKNYGVPFTRYFVGNPGGFLAGTTDADGNEETQGYFGNNQATAMTQASLKAYAGTALDGSREAEIVGSPFPTPYTTTGVAGGTTGDVVEAWTTALSGFRSLDPSTASSTISAYVGYGINYTDATLTTVDDTVISFAPDWNTSVKEPSSYPVDELNRQWTIWQNIGFDTMSFDAGTRVSRYDAETDGQLGAVRVRDISATINDDIMFELITRNADGTPKDLSPDVYQMTRHWGLWPTSSGIEVTGNYYGRKNESNNSVLKLHTYSLDPTTTECHIVIDLAALCNTDADPNIGWKNVVNVNSSVASGDPLTWADVTAMIDAMDAAGFVVSCFAKPSSFNTPYSPDDVIKYILDRNYVPSP